MSPGPATAGPGAVAGGAPPGLGRRAVRGAVVTLGAQGARIGVQLLSVVLLSRLLDPREYGLLGMVVVVLGVADVFRDMGLSTAAVQARTLTTGQRANLFWLNAGVGLLLSLAALACAPLLGALYGEPDLVALTQVLAWTFLLNGMATQYRADLTRRMLFTRLALADVLSPVVALAAAVWLAASGAGVWALAGQQLTQYAVMLAVVVPAARWLPGRPDRRAPMGGMLRFGWTMVGTQLVGYLSNNVDSLTVGTRFGAEALGLYTRAFQLLMTPLGQLRGPTTQVALPVLASLQDEPDRFAGAVRRGQLALGYTLVAALGLVLGAAGPVTAVFLGGQWSSTTPLLRWLALAGVLQTLAFVSYWVYLARGLTGALLRYSLVQAAIRVVCIVGGSAWGPAGVAAGYALAPAVGWPLSFWWLSRITPIPVRELVHGALRVLALTLTVAGCSQLAVLGCAGAPPALALAAAVLAGGLGYAVLVAAVPRMRADAAEVAGTIRSGLRRRGR